MKHSLKLNNEQIRSRAHQIIDSVHLDPVHELIIRPAKSKRSLSQNSTVHGWFRYVSLEYAEATGKFYTQEQWKEYFKSLFGYTEEVEIMGKVIVRQKSTADYTTDEMREFMNNLDNYCGSELQIFLPMPGMEE
jgi:hypothetical protein